MSQDICGKWYVYRYSLNNAHPVLKDPETTLEICRQTRDGCLARFGLRGWAEPVEIEMIVEDGEWHSKEEGIFLSFRWECVEYCEEEPTMLAGQVFNPDDWELQERDFFIAVRSRRTSRLPKQPVYHFEGIYSTPLKRNERARKWDDMEKGIDLKIWDDQGKELEKKVMQVDGSNYTVETLQFYHGGLKIVGLREPGAEGAVGTDHFGFWILPVVEPGRPGRLLATGFHEYHTELNSGSKPECQKGSHFR